DDSDWHSFRALSLSEHPAVPAGNHQRDAQQRKNQPEHLLLRIGKFEDSASHGSPPVTGRTAKLASQSSVGGCASSMTRTGTSARVGSSLRPSCSRTAVKIDGASVAADAAPFA